MSGKSSEKPSGATDLLDSYLEKWQKDLIDLTRRNRLINLSGRGTILHLSEPGYKRVLERLAEPGFPGWRFHYPRPKPEELAEDPNLQGALLAEDPDLDDELKDDELLVNVQTGVLLSKRLRSLERKASSEFIDRGLRVLYLTIGVLRWEDSKNECLESPLILVPVVLQRFSPREPFRLCSAEEDWVVNPALATKLESEFELHLPSFEGQDLEAFLRDVKSLVRGYPAWDVEERMSIAALSFQKETMYQDLVDNQEEIKENLSVQAFTGRVKAREELQFEPLDPSSETLDKEHPPEELHSILDADGTQHACIVAAKQGRSFVMDGPPGSGKSQTIANVIAELLGDGKTVLFVSEKAAALEVVQQRLENAHLGEFVLELHSHKSTRKAVATALGDSILRRLTPSRTQAVDIETLKKRRTELTQYASAVNEPRALSATINNLHDAIGRIGQLSKFPSVHIEQGVVDDLDSEQFRSILEWAAQIGRAWGPISLGEDFLWRELTSSTIATPQAQINAQLDEALRRVGRLEKLGSGFAEQLGLSEPRSVADLSKLVEVSRHLASKPDLNTGWFGSSVPELSELTNHLSNQAEKIQECRAALIEDELDPSTLPEHSLELAKAICVGGDRISLDQSLVSLAQVSHDISESERRSEELLEAISAFAGELGVPLVDATPKFAEQLLALFDLSLEQHRPAANWLEAHQIGRVRTALTVLEPLVDEWRTAEAKLKQHFNDNISYVNIETFYDSESDVQAKLGRFSARGRANRKQLAACAREGKLTQDVVSLLPLARSWRALTKRLEGLEEAQILGPYFRGSATDLSAVSDALSVADSVLELSGQNADYEKIGKIVGFNQALQHSLKQQRIDLEEKLDHYRVRPFTSRRSEDAGELSLITAEIEECRIEKNIVDGLVAVAQPYVAHDDASVGRAQRNAGLNAELIAATLAFEEASNPERLEPHFKGLDTDWSSLSNALQWVETMLSLEDGSKDSVIAEAISETDQDEELELAFTEFNSGVDEVLKFFEPKQQEFLIALLRGSITESSDLLQALRESSADIAEWAEFERARCEMQSMGLTPVLDVAIEKGIPGEEIALLAEKIVLENWVDQEMRSDSRLSRGRREDRDNIVDQFRELDRAISQTAIQRVIDRCEERRPSSASGEFAIIDHEAKKKRRHMSVQSLLKRAGTAAVDLKPCFMMSPLSVSQFLPSEIRFDCVIFDEASQVKPADAINAIYRGEQLIVAGDERQLPPTSFFDRSTSDDDEYDEEAPDEFESILNLAKLGLQQLPLRWHYRSLHESLISFSNREYYNSELISYPGAVQKSDDLGVHFEYVEDGVYARGGAKDNVVEARRVVERVIEHAKQRPHLSVGVVAFSDAQASRIEWELDAIRRTEHPELDEYFSEDRLNGFFIKNLESVQGDERDIIIFSVGYGRDEFGKLTMNFGPVGQAGGGRRLNVAVTRAKRRVEVVSSIRATDFADTGNPQVLSFRRYLDYAERGIAAFADDRSRSEETDSPFEQDVLEVIRSLGFEPHPQVGQAGYRIDIGVVHPEQPSGYVLGVECDGATYHSSRVARDRDRLRQDVLEGLGWNIHRIWSTSWFRDREAEIEKLREQIELAISQPAGSAKQQPRVQKAPAPEVFEIDPIVAEWADEYDPDLSKISPSSDFVDSGSRVEARRTILRAVAALAPVPLELIESAIREIHGFKAMGQARKSILHSDLKAMVRNGSLLKDRHGFYWIADDLNVRVRSGNPEVAESIRPPGHVSPDEVKLALFFLVKDARSISEEDLILKTARLFGWKRAGSDICKVISKALRELKKNDDVVALDSGLLSTSEAEFPDLS